MEIKVVGTGCTACRKLEEMVRQVVEEQGISATIMKVENMMEIAKSGVLLTPGLIVDGKIVMSGKLPDKKEIERLLLS